MSKVNIISIFKSIHSAAIRHSPEICTGIGITGLVVTVVMAVKATPKALTLIEEKKEELDTDSLSGKEIVKTAWPCYIPSAVIGAISIGCVISGSSKNLHRNAALAAAYTLSESTLKEYQRKVIEVIGEKKEQEIKQSVAREKMDKNPIRDVILTSKGGDNICYDTISGRYFKSDRDTINRAVNEINRRMRDEMTISLNDLYYELGLDPIKIGEDLGWNIERGYIDVTFSTDMDANGTPCLVMDYEVAPIYDY